MYKSFKIILLSFFFPVLLFSQEKLKDGHKKFYFNNGQISSEGFIKNGKPEGYWITYYQSGLIKSEGNRKNHLLDSTWIFYDKLGNTTNKINYNKGLKNGLKISYSDSCNLVKEENFVNDIKQNFTTFYYDKDGKIKWKEINYEDNIEKGNAFEYGLDGRIITILVYKKGTLIGKEIINRYDKNNKKKNTWKKFYKSGKLKEEANYKNDLLNGYLKEYDEKGQLIKATLYINGTAQLFAEELDNLDIKKEYYPNGAIKKEGTYDVTGKEHGKFKFFNKKGKIENVEIYMHGILLARGVIDEEDRRQGYWEEYYVDGAIKSKGKYKDGKKIEVWEFFFTEYLEGGKPTGLWKWFHANGEILREEFFRKGLEDGMLYEYYDDGTLITKGEFIDGLKDGPWFYQMGDHIEEGSYRDGVKSGIWKYHYINGNINFEGNFVDGVEDGKHKYYYETGKLRNEEIYRVGVKSDSWKSFNELGELVLTVDYKEGKEFKINGTKLK